jgi:general secretion pathway protein C
MPEALPDLLTRHRLARPLATLTIAALAALLLLVAARLVWLVVDAATAPPPATPPPAVAPPPARADAGALERWHLFGNAAPGGDPRTLASAPDTDLELELRGVFAGDDPKLGHAIIADAGGDERGYAVGAELPGGALLDAVYADRVILTRGGVRETLRLSQREPSGAAPAPMHTARNTNLGGAPAPLPGATAAATPFVNSVIAPMPGVDWNAATTKLGVDPAQLARQVNALPVIEQGRFVGVRLVAGADVPLLARLGLRPDDVVTAVNGIPLDSPARAQQVASSLVGAQSATVTVRRGGKSQNLSVSLR